MLPWRPTAPQELSEGYIRAGVLARERALALRSIGQERDADPWERLAVYCEQMGHTRAIDDDQYEFQRQAMKHRREQPMTAAEMDAYGLFVVGTENRGIPEWQWAAMELALGYLPVMQRVCFEMVVAGRLTVKEVSEALNMSEAHVRNSVQRARKTFEKEVRPKLAHIFDERHKRAEAKTLSDFAT